MNQPTRIVIRDPALAIALEIQEEAGLDSTSAAVALTLTTYGPALLHFLRNPLGATETAPLLEVDASQDLKATDAFEVL